MKPLESASKRSARQHRARLRELERVTLGDVRRARYQGLVAPSLRRFAIEAEHELSALLADKGDGVTAGERAVLEDVARLGLLLRATFAVYLEQPQPELAKTVAALAGQRRASLAAVGMDRRAKAITVSSVVAGISASKAAQDGAGPTIDVAPVQDDEHAEDGS